MADCIRLTSAFSWWTSTKNTPPWSRFSKAVRVEMPINQFVNGKMSMGLVSRLAAGQRDAIAAEEARVQEPEQRALVLEVADQAAFDLLDATAPKACSIASSSHIRNTNSTCSSGSSNSPAIRALQMIRRRPYTGRFRKRDIRRPQ